MGDNFSDKQKRFIEEYLKDLNATQAAIRAGYSKRTAEVQGCRLLSNVKVFSAIRAKQDELSIRNEISVDRVVSAIKEIAFIDMEDILKYNKSGRIRFKVMNKVRALELLGKHIGMWNK